jgi:DNA-binding transcriptional LysR family regulator
MDRKLRFKGLDLNLLVALDALLETRSVSAAAGRLNLSQPAMSAALSRLRDYFGDELLVASGKRMHPTAYAEVLLPQLKESLASLDSLISNPTLFDPMTSHRTFRILGSDYVTAAALVPLIERLAEEAPGVRLDIGPVQDDATEQIEEGKVDLLLTPDNHIHPDHPADLLWEERQVIVGWNRNPLFGHPVTEEAVFAAGHVAVLMGRIRTPSFADRELAIMGKVRRIEVATSSFLAVPWLLQGTNRLAFMHERLARSVVKLFPLEWAPTPFDFPIMREMVQHHRARSGDAGLTWLRRKMAEVAAEIDAVDPNQSKQSNLRIHVAR